ncbi:replication initiation protein [Tortoise microvirus 93]|nr:replication initiation protein [Tortoise microvirus 93]
MCILYTPMYFTRLKQLERCLNSERQNSNDVPCLFPYHVENPAFPIRSKERYLPVPCGKCPPCCERKSNAWQFRLLQQEKVSDSAAFITLTYNTDHVPISKRGYMTLDKTDFQKFMKRLRKLHPFTTKISYYAVGEYGSTTFRPHYHAIIFNCDLTQIQKAWTNPKTNKPIGECHAGSVTGASIAYTCKYLSKGKIIPVHANDDRLPEFSLMSKKLGANYLTPAAIEYHKADITRNYVTLEGGVKIAMPRYYREKIYNDEERHEQGKQIAKSSERAEQSRRDAHARTTGRPDLYERDQLEGKRSIIRNARQRAKNNRRKI